MNSLRDRGTGGPTRNEVPRKKISKFKMETDDPLAGVVVHGRYELMGRLGRGGMGAVYLAHDRQDGSHVAIKVLSEDLIASDRKAEIIERFFREAKAVKLIDHPNVVKIFDVGSFGTRIFYVMECYEGEDLNKVVKRERRVDWDWLAPRLLQICDGVQAAHDANIIHRDLKPANIQLARNNGDEVVKVLDFGVAKSLDAESLTRSKGVVGTVDYIAPEVIALGSKNCDHRIDVYAIGVIMYRALTGVLPFEADEELERLLMRTKSMPASPREVCGDIPPAVDVMVMKALAMDRERRYQSAAELKAAVLECMAAPMASPTIAEMEAVRPPLVIRVSEDSQSTGESSASGNISALREHERERPGGAWRFIKRAVILGALAAGGYAAYANWDWVETQGRRAYEAARSEFEQRTGKREAGPAPTGSAVESGYVISVDSSPQGAHVYLMEGNRRQEHLGTTPLRRRVPEGQQEVLVVMRGRRPERRTVSEISPGVSVQLQARQARQRQQSPEPEPEEDLPPEIILEENPQ